MKAIASVAIAAAFAAATLTSTVTPADAGGNSWKWKQQQYHGKQYKHGGKHYKNYNKGWNPGAALAAGAILGLTFGALAAQPNYYYAPAYPPPPPPPVPPYPAYSYSYGMSPQHVSFCYSKYKSYNVQYNTWIGYDGRVHQCLSPY